MSRIAKLMRVILSYPCRFFNGISLRATVVDSKIHKTAKIQRRANVRYSSVGRYSYISANASAIHTKIGDFCSIASGVAIGGGSHDISAVSTSPIFSKGRNIFNKNFASLEYDPYKETVIGNDVWIGNRAIILQGVTVGNGAVVGAGSVVTKDVPPYTVVAGNPAREIKKRFDDETIDNLSKLEWWEMSDAELLKYGEFFNSPQELIKQIGGTDK